jgi:hypothetical protein
VNSRRSIASVLATLVVAAGLCAGAWATPNKQQYDNPAQSEPTTVAPATPSTTKPGKSTTPGKNTTNEVIGAMTPPTQPQAVESGTLPFTGQNIALVVLIGGVLVAAGIGLRRARWHDR